MARRNLDSDGETISRMTDAQLRRTRRNMGLSTDARGMAAGRRSLNMTGEEKKAYVEGLRKRGPR